MLAEDEDAVLVHRASCSTSISDRYASAAPRPGQRQHRIGRPVLLDDALRGEVGLVPLAPCGAHPLAIAGVAETLGDGCGERHWIAWRDQAPGDAVHDLIGDSCNASRSEERRVAAEG